MSSTDCESVGAQSSSETLCKSEFKNKYIKTYFMSSSKLYSIAIFIYKCSIRVYITYSAYLNHYGNTNLLYYSYSTTNVVYNIFSKPLIRTAQIGSLTIWNACELYLHDKLFSLLDFLAIISQKRCKSGNPNHF